MDDIGGTEAAGEPGCNSITEFINDNPETIPDGWDIPHDCFESEQKHLYKELPADSFLCYFLAETNKETPIRLWSTKTYTIGRSPVCDLVVDHPDISETHAAIQITNEGPVLIALGSRHGIGVNGRAASRHVLAANDEIRIANTTFHLLTGQESKMRNLFKVRANVSGLLKKADGGVDDADASFKGNLAEIKIADLIQFLCSTGKSGSLTINSGREQGRVSIEDGNIVFAEVGSQSGSDAIYHVMGWTVGSFEFGRVIHHRKRNVSSTTIMLLLEGARRQDESRKS